jgi:SulP family sulfate permease
MLGMLISIIFILLHNFRNAYERTVDQQGKNHQHFINLAEEVSFLNKGAILQLLNDIPENSRVTIDGTRSKIIDYDIYEIIKDFQSNAKSKKIELTLKGINLNKI